MAPSRDTNQIARILTRDFCLPIADTTLDQVESLHAFLQLRAVKKSLDGFSDEQREHFCTAMKAAGKHPDVQRQRIPMPGAVAALQELVREGARIIYPTCRQPESEQLTRAWLAQHGFPAPELAYCCQHYHYKLLKAYEFAAPDERIVVIDDRVKEVITGVVALYQRSHEVARSLAPRLAVVAFACERLPTFPMTLPFPVATLASWHPQELRKLHRASASLVNERVFL